jgi:hypothetical protein
MAEGIITGANNASAIATVVAAKALAPLRSETCAWGIATMDYEDEIKQFGSTVNIPIPAEFTTNLMADGGTVTRQANNLGNAALVLNKHRELTWEHTDINKALATPNLEGCSAGQAIANFAEDMDEDLLGIYASFTGTAVGAYNTALTEAVIDAAETGLFDARVPGGARKSLVVTGTGYSNLRLIPRFTENDKRGNGDAASDRLMGRLKGFDVYRAQKTNVTSSTNRHGIAMGPAALLGAVRNLGTDAAALGGVQVEMQEDGVTLRMTMSYDHPVLGRMTTIDTLYGFVCGRTAHGIEVKH